MKKKYLLPALFALFSPLALAHPGHIGSHGFESGFIHPLTGLDHLSVMLGVGMLAALVGGKAKFRMPLAFVAVMIIGGALGVSGLVVPGVETGIAISVVAMGVMLCSGAHLSEKAILALVMGFALFHGMAHGMEMPMDSQAFWYFSGFVLATAMLHVTGIFLAQLIAACSSNRRVMRVTGAVMAVFGGSLMLS
ncbi:HupE-UreJ family metal transporter [Photobacterium marinum]|uniref:HupE-UreJ family metal transporter n=1 Tax=Photobacterium marinum TaxID=1056511 RepID=L8J8I9_9GAMM|nr:MULTISPECIES: HupE/UreJ family protein [Photobacterium]ELR63864.1 HupE-UreJ family metal transporter [Photobacterium marinum]